MSSSDVWYDSRVRASRSRFSTLRVPKARMSFVTGLVAGFAFFGCGSGAKKATSGVQRGSRSEQRVVPPVQEGKVLNPGAPSKQALVLPSARIGPAIAQFGRHLYLKESERSKGNENLVISPWSVYRALSVARSGALGQTAAQLDRALGLPAQADAHRSIAAIGRVTASALEAAYNVWVDNGEVATFGAANGLFVDDSVAFNPEFVERNRMTIEVDLIGKRFEGQVRRSRLQINQWVKKETSGIIRNLLEPGTIKRTTRFMVIDAIRFKGGWAYPFNKKYTTPRPFGGRGEAKKLMPTMQIVSDFRVLERKGLGYRAVDLPYEPRQVSMTIILPDEGTDLRALESKLDFASVARAIDKSPNRTTLLSLPRFQAQAVQSMSLTQSLRELGIIDAFDPSKADFSGMTRTRGTLAIDDVVHKAVVGVSEEGVVGVPAVPGSIDPGGGAKEVYELRINRPFLFFVRDKKTQVVFFIGRVIDPKSPAPRRD